MHTGEWRDKLLQWVKEDDRLERLPFVFIDTLAQRIAWQEFDNTSQQSAQSDCAYCHCSTVILSDGVHCIECGRVYKSHSH